MCLNKRDPFTNFSIRFITTEIKLAWKPNKVLEGKFSREKDKRKMLLESPIKESMA